MKKLILLIAVFALLFSFNKVEAQTKLQTAVPMLVFGADSLIADTIPAGDNIFFSKTDVTYAIQAVLAKQSGTMDGKVIRQRSIDGVNYIDIDTLQLVDAATQNDITTFTATSWASFYLRFRYAEVTAAGIDLDIYIYATENK